MDNGSPDKGKMDMFVEGLYGIVIGVSFYQPVFKKNTFDLNCRIPWCTTQPFYFILFLFTLIIAAHDWYFFHNHAEKRTFFQYLPTIFSLFCLSQMFVVASKGIHFMLWLIWGIVYTVLNIISHFCLYRGFYRNKWHQSYVYHLAVGAVSIFFTALFDKSLVCRYILLLIIMVVVVLLWIKVEKKT